jgi:hypothetical protein
VRGSSIHEASRAKSFEKSTRAARYAGCSIGGFHKEPPLNTLEHDHSISRREFTREWVLAMLAGAAITITGCSDSKSPTAPSQGGGGSTTQDVSGTVSANHGHVATVTAAQITAAGAVSLDIMGQATHPHTVSLTASQVQQIGSRQQVAVTSTTDAGHQHTVTFN